MLEEIRAACLTVRRERTGNIRGRGAHPARGMKKNTSGEMDFTELSSWEYPIIMKMIAFDLCLAWSWEYDAAFARLLEAACGRSGLSLLQVTPETLENILERLGTRQVCFSALLDRAGDADPRFQPLDERARAEGILRINPAERTRWAWDKATMHLEFIHAGLITPFTLILPPFESQPEFPAPDLSILGERFAIKPVIGGGGEGVVLEAVSWDQVREARRQFPHQKYLLQAHITPQSLDGRPAWFRVLVCAGAIFPCWWDPATHVYTRLTAEQRFRFGLVGLRSVAARIASICRLDLFSTEIALVADGSLVVVDYVNDPVDLRLRSLAVDGVPDTIVEAIASCIARMVHNR